MIVLQLKVYFIQSALISSSKSLSETLIQYQLNNFFLCQSYVITVQYVRWKFQL